MNTETRGKSAKRKAPPKTQKPLPEPLAQEIRPMARTNGMPHPMPVREQPATSLLARPTQRRPSSTEVQANIDVGFGNQLFIRGQGDGLTWDKGLPLACVAPGIWRWSTQAANQELVFKLLLNDEVWSQGEDWKLPAGERIEIEPSF